MNQSKNLLHHLAEAYGEYKAGRGTVVSSSVSINGENGRLHRLKWFVPNGGTILLFCLLILTQRVWATPAQNTDAPGPSATTINYQGNLTDSSGSPKNGSFDMTFSLWDAASGGAKKWGAESHAGVPVSNGSFNIGLGSKTSGGIPTTIWNGDRYLEITVGGETLAPRELIRSVPIAGLALKAESANSLPVQHVQKSQSGWTPFRNARNFITEFDSPITISRRSLILLVYSGSINCAQGSQDCYLKFYRDSQLILDGPYANGSMTADQPISAQVTEVVAPGTYTYRLYIDSTQSATQARVFGSTLSIIIIPIE